MRNNRESRAFYRLAYDVEDEMSKRELIDTGSDKRYVRRDDDGRFKQIP